jgi:hypothetical protein
VVVSSEYIAIGGLFLFLYLSRLYSELVLLLLYFVLYPSQLDSYSLKNNLFVRGDVDLRDVSALLPAAAIFSKRRTGVLTEARATLRASNLHRDYSYSASNQHVTPPHRLRRHHRQEGATPP